MDSQRIVYFQKDWIDIREEHNSSSKRPGPPRRCGTISNLDILQTIGIPSGRFSIDFLPEASYASSKNMSAFGLNVSNPLEELSTALLPQSSTIVTVKIINSLGSQF